jgi:2-methylcitrate dehydratase
MATNATLDPVESAGETIARNLATYTAGFAAKDVPEHTMYWARLILLDALGCAIGGLGCDAARILEETSEDLGGNPEATIIGSGRRTSVLNATAVNGALVRYLDCNDGYMVITPRGITGGHPSDMIPMILALAERQGTSGLDVLSTIVLGYQLYGRLGECEQSPLAVHGWAIETKCPLFTPLIAGKLLGLSIDQLEQAVGISGTHGMVLGILDTDGEEYGMTKNIRFARTAQQGVVAAYQAARGFTGTRRVIEGHQGWKEVIMGDDFRIDQLELDGTKVGYAIDRTFIKQFSADGSQLGHLSATYGLVTKHDIRPDDIASVLIRCTRRCGVHCGGPEKENPTTKELADHSIYYTTAALITHRALGPAQYTAEVLADPGIRALMKRVTMAPDAELDRFGAAGVSEITLKSGEVHRAMVEYPRGHAGNPMEGEEIVEKFRAMVRPILGDAAADRIEREVMALGEAKDVSSLMQSLIVK